MLDAWDEHGHPLEDDPESLKYLEWFAEICYHANVRMPLPGEGFTIVAYCQWLHAWAAKRAKRRRAQLLLAAERVAVLLDTSSAAARRLAKTRPSSRACPICADAARRFLFQSLAVDPDIPELTVFGVTVKADGSVVNNADTDSVLHRDHLELSRFFRGRFCNFHNTSVVHQVDEFSNNANATLSVRVYENARTYLDDTPPPSDGEESSSGSD
jgi:hypothetical protein